MCARCGHQTSVTAGTIFHRSHLPLRAWFRAMWWVTNQKHGVSALGLQRLLGLGSYETAWACLQKLRRAKVIRGSGKTASTLLPRVHRAASLLKRWLLGTHQGGVSREQLDYYLDEFTFRFNRRTSQYRGKLFYRIVQQAVVIQPTPFAKLVAQPNHNT